MISEKAKLVVGVAAVVLAALAVRIVVPKPEHKDIDITAMTVVPTIAYSPDDAPPKAPATLAPPDILTEWQAIAEKSRLKGSIAPEEQLEKEPPEIMPVVSGNMVQRKMPPRGNILTEWKDTPVNRGKYLPNIKQPQPDAQWKENVEKARLKAAQLPLFPSAPLPGPSPPPNVQP